MWKETFLLKKSDKILREINYGEFISRKSEW